MLKTKLFFFFFPLKPVEVEQPVYYDKQWNSTFFFLFKIISFLVDRAKKMCIWGMYVWI